ncbi:zinc finger BED domain-containing protein RICESLEEPER 2-like [Impatiens glandulifera]|uniref:zinc finger BED domain-containing protein RICESLEEPER 2-like n=1 Tax=Impatiens glandulifera TaxID=253017 RepID=UPI001FB11DE3|nr:zinc finger BED domain-containing protein RICESLEEPER 2-like [Impatiens glandulifera]
MSISNQDMQDNATSHSFDHSESEESVKALKDDDDEESNHAFVFDQDKCGKALVRMIITDELPLSIVDNNSFRVFSRSLQPLLRFPSRKQVELDIIKIHDHERVRVKRMLQANESRVAISTNSWTCHDEFHYMMVNAHFIDCNWVLQSCVLRFVNLPDPDMKNQVGEVLLRTLLEWDLDRKVSTITGDSRSKSDSILESVVWKLQKNSLILSRDFDFVKVRCCADIVNSIVEYGMDTISDSVKNISESCDYWTESLDRRERFVEIGVELGLSMSTYLVSDCDHKWTSTYSMLKTALPYKLVFNQCSLLDNEYKTKPSDTEWDLANETCVRLESVCSITKLFFETKYPTAFLYFQMVCDLKLVLNDWLACSNQVVQNIAARMMKKFTRYLDHMHILMGVVAVLDPRTKLHLVEFSFAKLFPSDSDQKVKRVVQICNDLVKEYQTRVSLHTSTSSNPDTNVSSNPRYQISPEFEIYIQQRIKKTEVKSELEYYLEDDLESRTSDFDILAYWKANLKYPTLKAIARDLLAMSVSRVVYKSPFRDGDRISAFSDGNRILSPARSGLDLNILEVLMCSKSWLSGSESGDISREMHDIGMDDDYDADEMGIFLYI